MVITLTTHDRTTGHGVYVEICSNEGKNVLCTITGQATTYWYEDEFYDQIRYGRYYINDEHYIISNILSLR